MQPPKVPMVPEAQGTDILPVSRDEGARWRVSLFQIRKWLIASGITGSPGPQGPPGDRGETGTAGPQGAVGTQGQKGEAGATGAQGPQGAAGVAGAVGPQGTTGSQGPKGDVGPAGATGANGATGATGATGPAGATGLAGKDASTVLGTITIGETILLAITLAGIRRVQITTPTAWAVLPGQSLMAIPTAAVPAGYAVHDVIVTADNKLSIAVSVPALALGAVYSIPCKLHRLIG